MKNLIYYYVFYITVLQFFYVHASVQKQSTAQGTVSLLGSMSDSINTTTVFTPSLSLRFTTADVTLHRGSTNIHFSNTIISIHGRSYYTQQTPPLLLHPIPSITHDTKPSTTHTQHTFVLNHTDLYILDDSVKAIHPLWHADFTHTSWKQIPFFTNRTDSSMIVYHQWLITCFGQHNKTMLNSCVWFDTVRNTTRIVYQPNAWPSARHGASMTSIDSHQFILFGGASHNTILDDVWQLSIHTPFNMTWQKLKGPSGHYRRSGHIGIHLHHDLVLYDSSKHNPSPALYLNLTNRAWISPTHHLLRRQDPDTTQHPIPMGTILGIVIGIVCLVSIGMALFIWKRNARQRKTLTSRATRFSQSPAPSSVVEKETHALETAAQQGRFLSLPELAQQNQFSKNRISTVSLGPEFCFSTTNNPSASSNTSLPHIAVHAQPESNPSLKKLTLHLFSSPTLSQTKERRRSSVFALRSSRFLQPGTPHTPRFSPHSLNSRTSFSAKSVSSVQWVGFNDTMDYNGSRWRDSSASSLHLAVTNAQSAQNTPKSPMFPRHLKDPSERDPISLK